MRVCPFVRNFVCFLCPRSTYSARMRDRNGAEQDTDFYRRRPVTCIRLYGHSTNP
uniref:Uncharacterized protein n=1 Tax=Oryza brachyantha TaxID=4533 RepID=J3LJB1_ORYBR